MKYKTVEHTADVGVEVEADTADELFEGAALAMFSLMVDLPGVRQTLERRLSISAGDIDELMFVWLNELLLLAETEGLLLSGFEVRVDDRKKLEALAKGEKFDPARHNLLEEIKAATYHELSVKSSRDGWRARIIFDV